VKRSGVRKKLAVDTTTRRLAFKEDLQGRLAFKEVGQREDLERKVVASTGTQGKSECTSLFSFCQDLPMGQCLKTLTRGVFLKTC
jgi:hypothetical protein